jgi:hypothetical protein
MHSRVASRDKRDYYGLYGVSDLPAVGEIQPEPARCDAGLGLWDLPHYIFIIWRQYAVYDYSIPAFVKFTIVSAGTWAGIWALVVALRKIAVVARMIRGMAAHGRIFVIVVGA